MPDIIYYRRKQKPAVASLGCQNCNAKCGQVSDWLSKGFIKPPGVCFFRLFSGDDPGCDQHMHTVYLIGLGEPESSESNEHQEFFPRAGRFLSGKSLPDILSRAECGVVLWASLVLLLVVWQYEKKKGIF